MPSSCFFEFDHTNSVYYSGETITGRVKLTTTSEKCVRDIYIQFVGDAKVRWEESKTRTIDNKSETFTENYSANETYLHKRIYVFGQGVLPAGTHIYAYSIPLPNECPSSCVERHGQVNYEISLVLNRQYRFDNVFKRHLTVIKRFDLNLHPEYLIPVQGSDTKYFCCWRCVSGPVVSTLTIPFGAYAPGQKINYKLEIDNRSAGYDLNGITLQLRQIYRFTAHKPEHKYHFHEKTLSQLEQEHRCLRLSKRLLEGTLTVPQVPPTSQGRTIIGVTYMIKVYIKTGGCHKDAEIEVPIAIGTIALTQSAAGQSQAMAIPSSAAYADIIPINAADSLVDSPPSYDENTQPPTYEMAISMAGQNLNADIGIARQARETHIPATTTSHEAIRPLLQHITGHQPQPPQRRFNYSLQDTIVV